ncbi:MFS transporter [Actinocatenispora thailandica]|uniref:MFS transporter n=1 Tax=Actinocatenispora thailandica TaxID=227318 RepID=A0A7R7DK36_9ACTN|nr:MFS transporter [Actinocatenispora thailandica]BCJ33179.1 MFS transporter [Actinocatenispora thailandica]
MATSFTTAPAPTDAPGMPPLARRMFAGIAFSALGSGMSMPYLFVYFTQVRHLPTTQVGLILSWMGVVALVVSPLAGTLIDRFGPRVVLLVGLLGEATGMAAVGFIHSSLDAIVVASWVAVFNCATFPGSSALLTRMVPVAKRERAYGVQFMLMNAGFGVGGLVASALVDLADPRTFQWLYWIDAASYVGYIVVLLTLPRGTGTLDPTSAEHDTATPQPGWREVLRDRTLLLVIVVGTVLLTCAYAQMDTGFTAYAVNQAQVPARTLGWAFAANTVVIVAGQLVTLRLVAGRRRSTALGIAGLIWSAAWVVVAVSGAFVGRPLAIVAVVLGLAVFGAGETIWAPVMPALVNGLADERVRGRYNALAGMTWTISGIAGPALAGLLIARADGRYWAALCIGGSLLGGLAFLTLRRRLTSAQDGLAPTPRPEPAQSAT